MGTARKIIAVLTPAQRRRTAFLFGLMLISMVLETVGVGLIIPFVALVSQASIAERYPAVEPVLVWLGNPDQTELIVYGMLGLLTFFGFKNLFLAFMSWTRTRIVTDTQAALARRLFAGYLRQPYTFHLQRNSAQMIRDVSTETSRYTTGLSSLLELTTQALVVLGVGVLLIVVEPVGAGLAILVVSVAVWIYRLSTMHRIRAWGKARRFHQGKVIQHLQQGLGGVKEVKLLGREQDFQTQFAGHVLHHARAERKQLFLAGLPKLWFEFVAVLGLAVLVLSLVAQGGPIETIVPVLAVFAAAAFRLMPKLGQIINSSQNLRYVGPVIDSLYHGLRELELAPRQVRIGPFEFQRDIRLDRVGFTYEGASAPALIDIDMTIPRGASVGIIGGSGAGKSTLVDVILGLIHPSQGQVLVDGSDIQGNVRGWQDHVGYVPQSIFLTDDTLRRNIAFGLGDSEIDDSAVTAAATAAQLDTLIAELPNGLDTLVGERGVRLSGGQRQRIGIARALYHNPVVLVLDEATSALDLDTEKGVMEAVESLKGDKTFIIVAHRLSTVAHCDRLYRLDQGRLVSEGAYHDVVQAKEASASA